MYEEPKLRILHFVDEDVIRTSKLFEDSEWSDENVDNDGWT